MNFKLRATIIIIIGIFVQTTLQAQNEKPKVALVLSGGGAKGIAHIPLLQKLDSLGIVPDMVIGTSMGAVIGGLYAMGYSGDSIAAITQEINWSRILGGKVYLTKVGNEEKSEFGRYLLDLNWRKGKPEISGGILNDQNLRELFSLLSYPVYVMYAVDPLPIP
jgi:NTE family protein